MSDASEIKELIKKIAHCGQIIVFTAEVTVVDDQHCTVVYGGVTLTKVKHFCIDDAGSLLIKPKVNSMVTVVGYDDLRDLQILKVQSIDKIIFNEGNLGGLTKTQELQTQLNKTNALLNAVILVLNGASIPEPGNGSPSALQTALKVALTGQQLGDYSNIEDTKFTH